MNKDITSKLLEEFPDRAHKSRKGGGGKNFTYVETHSYIHRLIDVTDNTYDWKINTFKIEGDLVTVMGTLTIPGLGSRDGIGVQTYKPGSGEDLVKGANSDAVKSAAKLFGVCLYLYGEDYEGEEDIKEAHPPQRPAKQEAKALPTPGDALSDARLHYAKKCQDFFKGNRLTAEELWSIYKWAVGDGKEKPQEAGVDDWLHAADEAKTALGALSRDLERIKQTNSGLHENKKTVVESGLPEALWQKLFSVAGGGR